MKFIHDYLLFIAPIQPLVAKNTNILLLLNSIRIRHTWLAVKFPCLSVQAVFCNDLTFLPSAIISKCVPLLTKNVIIITSQHMEKTEAGLLQF